MVASETVRVIGFLARRFLVGSFLSWTLVLRPFPVSGVADVLLGRPLVGGADAPVVVVASMTVSCCCCCCP